MMFPQFIAAFKPHSLVRYGRVMADADNVILPSALTKQEVAMRFALAGAPAAVPRGCDGRR
jgi:hypothetical protein